MLQPHGTSIRALEMFARSPYLAGPTELQFPSRFLLLCGVEVSSGLWQFCLHQ